MSSVKVGVRIRPLSKKERIQGKNHTLKETSSSSLTFKGKGYTFDHVFPTSFTQNDLYTATAAPMLRSFLEGYNVTIMAYGQTGSGKTYTMGTGDVSQEDEDEQGLIPRFVTDLFENIRTEKENMDNIEGKFAPQVTVSFMEIYGEDVFDLMASEGTPSMTSTHKERTSLPVREDEKGGVFVQGVTEINVNSASAALELLCRGTRNRITASTAMNAGSSRSHAVFSVTLEQHLKPTSSDLAEVTDTTERVISKLTFVDLAGSERLKRTNAEGQRMKEGIQINSGLFNLGQVINALADEQRLKQGKSTFVPYRNSKLTHLLKDALGGNSQTLFLACVSPAESDEGETQSSLGYARSARNIQNKPVRNMDPAQMEMRRLRYLVKAWMIKACGHMFANGQEGNGTPTRLTGAARLEASPLPAALFSPGGPASCEASSAYDLDLLKRPDVQEYVQAVHAIIANRLHMSLESEETTSLSPRKAARLSLGTSPVRPLCSLRSRMSQIPHENLPASRVARKAELDEEDAPRRGSVLTNLHPESLESLQSSKDPEETERLVTRMIEMVNKEKEMYGAQLDTEQQQQGEERIQEMEHAIHEKEVILSQLMDTVKGYGAMKADFEKLLGEIGSLEIERQSLEIELENAKRDHEREQHQKGTTTNSVVVERIKERFLKVKKELESMREERKQKENAYRLMQRENKQCETLIKEIERMKSNRVELMKAQKAAILGFQKKEREAASQVGTLRRIDVKKQQEMNNLKSEIVKKDRVLGHKEREIGRINSKLRACEEHIAQLLRIQNKNRARLDAKSSNASMLTTAYSLSVEELELLKSSKGILDNLVTDRVEMRVLRDAYECKRAALQQLNQEMVQEAMQMEDLLKQREVAASKNCATASVSAMEADALRDAEVEQLDKQIAVCEAGIDRITRDLDVYNSDLDDLSERLNQNKPVVANGGRKLAPHETWEDIGREVIAGLALSQFKALTWDLLADKANGLEELRAMQIENGTLKSQKEQLSDRLGEAERALAAMRADVKQRLEAAEQQRVQDVWAVLRASDTAVAGDMSEANSRTAVGVALQRAQELEHELETLSASEEEQRRTLAERDTQLQETRESLGALQLRERALSAMVAETQSDALKQHEQSYLELSMVWDQLGLETSQREQAVSRLNDARPFVHATLMDSARGALAQATTEAEGLHNDIGVMQAVLVTSSTQANFQSESNMLKLVDQLKREYAAIEATFTIRAKRLLEVKDQMLMLMSEMWLEPRELSEPLRPLLQIAVGNNMPALARNMQSEGLNLEDASISRWEHALRKLNVQRGQTTTKLIQVLEKAQTLGSTLQILDEQQLRQVLSHAPLDDVSTRAVDGAIELLLSAPTGNPPGAEALLVALERVLLLLESVRVNRSTALQLSQRFADTFHKATNIAAVTNVSTGDGVAVNRSTLTAVIQTAFDSAMQAETMLPELRERLHKTLTAIEGDDRGAAAMAAVLETVLSVKLSVESAIQESDPLHALANMDSILNELGSVALCTEEPWLRLALEEWRSDWDPQGVRAVNDAGEEIMAGRECVRQALLLHAECKRLDAINAVKRDLMAYDEQLARHIQEMEDFETTSKQDRGKILKGSSTALLAEEKYRRNGKKKYEVLTAHIFSSSAALQAILAEASAGNIQAAVNLRMLSSSTHELLRSKKVMHLERVELMHLHTINHGTRRWSNEGEEEAGQDENAPPVPNNGLAGLQSVKPPAAPNAVPDKSAGLSKPSKGSPVPVSTNATKVQQARPKREDSVSTGFKSLDYVRMS